MRISRDYLFDMIEMVGKAIATARAKPADESWLDALLPGWIRNRQPRKNPKAHTEGHDEFGLFDGTPWSSEEEASERTDLSTVVPGSKDDYGFGPVERKKASRTKHEYGDMIASELWHLQRQVRFKEVGVMDGLKDLQQLCRRLARGFISEGWANRLTQIIDEVSP